MSKAISAIKWLISSFFFLIIPVAVLIYLWWFWVAPPLTNTHNASAFWSGVILLLIYSVTVIFWRLVNNAGLKLFLLLFSIFWLFANTAYLGWFKPSLVDSITCNGTSYFMTFHADYWFSSWNYYQIIKKRGTEYKEIYWDYRLSANKMICDEQEKKMKAVIRSFLQLSDKIDIFDTESSTVYEMESRTDNLEGISYSLYSYKHLVDGVEMQSYLLTECKASNFESCKEIPIDHSLLAEEYEYGYIFVNLSTNDIYIFFDGKFHSIYGDETRKIDLLASQRTYQVLGYSKNNTYTYLLLVCRPPSSLKDCTYIPFSYTTKKPQSVELKIDKNILRTHKLFVYIGGNLVFIYDVFIDMNKCSAGCPHSQCMIEGCTIPGQ
ncbi:MAG: hypothetical protein L6461_02835 [Anaerolineae bacterium]|nr:hypothetical protein [Anaerolineae bacterium]